MDNNYFGNICYCRKCNGIVHTIKKGDSLYLLSRYYNVPIGEIMNANRNLNVYNLQIGEEICIPIRRSDMMNDNVNSGMNRTTSDMQTSDEVREEAVQGPEDMESTSVEVPFDKNLKMSDLINREDMTFEKFLSLIQN